jgi:hypothetical protein
MCLKVRERTLGHDEQLFGLRSIAALRLQARDPLSEFVNPILAVCNAFGNSHAIRRNIPHALFLQRKSATLNECTTNLKGFIEQMRAGET